MSESEIKEAAERYVRATWAAMEVEIMSQLQEIPQDLWPFVVRIVDHSQFPMSPVSLKVPIRPSQVEGMKGLCRELHSEDWEMPDYFMLTEHP